MDSSDELELKNLSSIRNKQGAIVDTLGTMDVKPRCSLFGTSFDQQ